MSQPTGKIRIGLIGAGTYARDAHVPSYLELPELFEIGAVFSRTTASAEKLVALLPHTPPVYTSLDELLARDDLEAVDIALPIVAQPDAVRRALAAGKHVISEKPLAPDTDTGRALLTVYRDFPEQVWLVGENFRYESAYEQAAYLVADGAIGTPRTCHWAVYAPVTPGSKYYASGWRRSGAFPGGFLLDGGVHHVAVMRAVLGEVITVSAVTQAISPELPPADTIAATLRFASGVVGTYLASYHASWPEATALHVAGDLGAISIYRDRIQLTRNGATESLPCQKFDGVGKELAAFAAAIRTGADHRNSPAEAFNDVAVIEAMLRAAQNGQCCPIDTLSAPGSPAINIT